MKKLMVLLMVLAMSGFAVAGPDWNNATGDGLWSTAGNWSGGILPGTGGASNWPAIHGVSESPLINANVAYQWVVQHGIYGTQSDALVVTTGGELTCHEYWLGGQNDTYNDAVVSVDGGWLQADIFKIGDSQSGTLNVSGGVVTAKNAGNQFLIGASGAWSRGKVNLTGGTIFADVFQMNGSAYQSDSRFFIDGGMFKLNGQQETLVNDYITNGWMLTSAGKVLDVSYDATWNETVVQAVAVPEPATMAILGLGGMLISRRRRK